MITFGFSAFLRIVSLNERPQRTQIRDRLRPSENAYDFHRSFRLRARKYLLDGETIPSLIASVSNIQQEKERASTIQALNNLQAWYEGAGRPKIFRANAVTYESPSKLFRIRFEPDFALYNNSGITAFHIWNTANPALSQNLVPVALTLIAQTAGTLDDASDTYGVLSVKPPIRSYYLQEYSMHLNAAEALVALIDSIIESVPPSADQLDDRPSF